MAHWLLKTEPDEFSIDDLAKHRREPWTGVRNYQARNFMRDGMQPGDAVLVYHSSCAVPGIAGIGKVLGSAYPDPTQFDRQSPYHDPASPRDAPRWLAIDIGYVRRLAAPITLEAIKAHAARFDGLLLLRRGNRLSVFPVAPAHYDALLALEERR
jgi:predicted RNA-binding protein with PUA-like domain